MKPHHLFPLLIVLCLLTACAAPAAVPTATLPPTAIASPTAAPAATRPPDTVTPTAAPTSTPLPPTLMPTAIPTPIPTLSPEDTKALLFRLLADNGGCQLPCLWGFTIGKTDLQTADDFLAQFGAFDQDNFYSTGPESVDRQGEKIFTNLEEPFGEEGRAFLRINFRYSYQEEISGIKTLKRIGIALASNTLFNAETDKLSGYGSNFPDPIQFYLLPNVLTQLGKPSQVWLLTWPEDPVRYIRPFDLILYYPDQGVFINYVVDRQKDGNDYLGCMGQASVSLSINHPGQEMDWKGLVGADVVDYYKPLEEATSLTLDQFYEQFKDPANTACIHTPQSLWVEAK